MNENLEQDKIREKVREGYTAIAKKGIFTTIQDNDSSCGSRGGWCGTNDFDVKDLVKSIGYSEEELSKVPASANMGLSCGNPTAITSIKEGEVVLDLGSGGGFFAFFLNP